MACSTCLELNGNPSDIMECCNTNPIALLYAASSEVAVADSTT